MMQDLDEVLIGTIDEVVRNVFEDETAEIIFRYLKEPENKSEDRVRYFADSLPKIIGTGSIIIEDLILEALYSKLGLELVRRKGFEFLDYIAELRKHNEEE